MCDSNGKTKRWHKILYKTSGFPDNFTPEESFLAAIEKNKNVRLYKLSECLTGAAVVGQEMSLVLIFWSLYECLKLELMTPTPVLLYLLTAVVTGYSYTVAVTQATWFTVFEGTKAGFLFIIMGYAVSPVLYQLTDTISSDTIHSMAGAGLCLHLLTHDYGLRSPLVSTSLSLNAAVFSAVCLASRFSTHYSAFSLLCLAATCFVLLPVSRPHSPTSSAFVGVAAVALVSCLNQTAALLSSILLLFVQLAFPLIFHRLQDHKSTIHGPWDEAVLHR